MERGSASCTSDPNLLPEVTVSSPQLAEDDGEGRGRDLERERGVVPHNEEGSGWVLEQEKGVTPPTSEQYQETLRGSEATLLFVATESHLGPPTAA